MNVELVEAQSTYLNHIKVLVATRKKTIGKLNELANELDNVNTNVNISKTVGFSGAIVGGGLAIGGILATILTAGAAAPIVAAVGIGVGVGGTLTSTGSMIAKKIIDGKTFKEAAALVQKELQARDEVSKQSHKLEQIISEYTSEGSHIKNGITIVKTGYNAYKDIKTTLKPLAVSGTSSIGIGTLKISLNIARTLAKVNIVLSSFSIGFDIYQLVKTAIELAKKRKSKTGDKIRELMRELETQLDDLERVVDEIQSNDSRYY
ncbi:uncharacterized protein LOC102800800 [Saccoglossus kowalevskii]|uniref:Apolipoprotein L3-like n=1 Tax=Saccoglossus kowalevskii TaxID=10224 RepID=A0ABM0LZ61_SACKO|nr:PREDICTED: apolipoprotein L3-like [Saccoglossus kowalevskii]